MKMKILLLLKIKKGNWKKIYKIQGDFFSPWSFQEEENRKKERSNTEVLTGTPLKLFCEEKENMTTMCRNNRAGNGIRQGCSGIMIRQMRKSVLEMMRMTS
ncbi:hypothetical protein C0J52_08701 [Blattella germanica]|nr:hypothetical protein C0J52_08701 [Blattella germanica]